MILHRPPLQKNFILSSMDSVALWRPLVTKKGDRKYADSLQQFTTLACRKWIASLQTYKGTVITSPAGSSSVGCGAIGGDRGDVEVGHPLCFAPIGCIFLQVHQTHCNQQL